MSDPLVIARDPLMAALVDRLPVGVLIADRDGNLELANELTRAQLERHPIPALAWIIARVLLTGEMVRKEEVTCLAAHNEWRTLHVCAVPVREAPGVITHALLTLVDVTHRNRPSI
jgi:PAS domain-containing protein